MRNPSSTSTKSSSPSKTTPCCTKLGLKRGPWTPEEDDLLSTYIHREGEGRWRTLPKRAGLLRCGKSCRLRWMNYLRPSVKRGQISPDEEDLILRLHRLLGNRWSLIAGRIPGRTDNEIKNYWNTHLSKKLISQGIDPRTHKPLNPADRQQPQQQTAVHELKGNSSSSSSKANRKTSSSTSVPKPPPPAGNTVSVGALGKEETNNTSGSNIQVINNKVNNSNNEYVQNTTTTATTSQYPTAAYTSGLLNCDGSLGGMDMIRSNIEEDEDLNYCTDDIFSSFLDSLINEDPFTTQQHQLFLQHQHQHPNGNIATTIPYDPNHLVSSLGFGTAWESTLMPSDTNDHKRVDDH